MWSITHMLLIKLFAIYPLETFALPKPDQLKITQCTVTRSLYAPVVCEQLAVELGQSSCTRTDVRQPGKLLCAPDRHPILWALMFL